MLGNLVQNAIQHGASDAPVAFSAHDEEDQVVLKVHNKVVPIPQAARHRIFDATCQNRRPARRAAEITWSRTWFVHRVDDRPSAPRLD
jgi:K+-sensing histidine kinase KdpD